MGSARKSTHPSYRNEVFTELEVYQKKDGSLYTPDTINSKDYKPVPANEKTLNDEIAEILKKNPDLAISNFKNGSNNPKRADVSPGDEPVGNLLVLANGQKILAVFNGESTKESFTLLKAVMNEPNSKVHRCEGLDFKFGYQGGGPGRKEITSPNQIAGHQIGILNEHIESHIESIKNSQYAEMLKRGPSGGDEGNSLSIPTSTPPAIKRSGALHI